MIVFCLALFPCGGLLGRVRLKDLWYQRDWEFFIGFCGDDVVAS
jgi:hypothetical protein